MTDSHSCETTFLDEDHVVEIVARLRQLYPESPIELAGTQERGMLLSALLQARQSFDGCDLYPTLAAKAAALFFFLIKDHPFRDGNKRFASFALGQFLDLNGFVLECPETELVAWAAWVASEESPTLEQVTYWLAGRLRLVKGA